MRLIPHPLLAESYDCRAYWGVIPCNLLQWGDYLWRLLETSSWEKKNDCTLYPPDLALLKIMMLILRWRLLKDATMKTLLSNNFNKNVATAEFLHNLWQIEKLHLQLSNMQASHPPTVFASTVLFVVSLISFMSYMRSRNQSTPPIFSLLQKPQVLLTNTAN